MMDTVNAVADEIANAVLKRLGPIASKKWTETNREIVDWVQVGLEKARDSALEEAAKVAEDRFERDKAHTYASENADCYSALEDAAEMIASAIRALKSERKP